MAKVCTGCDQQKQVGDYYKDKRAKDGLASMCKACIIKRRTEKRDARTPEDVERDRARGREYVRKFRKTSKGKDYYRKVYPKHPERWRAKDTNRRRARNAVANALRRGRLLRPIRCQQCQEPRALQAHHYKGYAPEHRLSVQWLCVECHGKEHRWQSLI